MDISRAYQEVKSLPDEALTKELEQPSGMVPGYLVMAELEDRKAIRSSSAQPQSKTSMKDELLQGIGTYSAGGLVASANPGYSDMMARMDPNIAAARMQEQMMQANKGYYPLNPPGQLQMPGAPQGLSSLMPPQAEQRPQGYAKGGEVDKPKLEDIVQRPNFIEVDGNYRPMPTMNSELMQRDMQGWNILQGNVDWSWPKPYLDAAAGPKKDDAGTGTVPQGVPDDGYSDTVGMARMSPMERRNWLLQQGGIMGLGRQ
jgi:hypothetical protein